MKKLLLFALIFFFWTLIHAQKHDNIWMSGYAGFTTIDHLGGTVYDFSGDSLNTYKEDKPMGFSYTHGVMCDSSGQLLFYTNGMYIANITHDTMLNGSGISPGFWHNEWLLIPNGGYRLHDGMIIVPDLKEKDQYRIFHVCLPEFNSGLPLQLLTTIVDMKGDNGLGEVIEKNKIVYQEQGQNLFQNHFDAVPHANGRDWWLVNILYDTREILLHLYTPDSIYHIQTQTILPYSKASIGECQFSPDGTQFAITDTRNKSIAVYDQSIHLYSFDRCSGQFTPEFHDLTTDTIIFANGVVFSPSGRYLYQTYEYYIFRYDTESIDVLATKDTLATWDGYIWYPWEGSPKFRTTFGFGELGPDGNIYVRSASASPYIHKITHPDDPALSEVIQRIPIPTANSWTSPNYPNYRLGALEGSPCAEMFGPPTAFFDFDTEALAVTFGDLSAGVPQTWLWDFGDGITSQEQHPHHTYTNDGTYTTCLTVTNLYGSTTYCSDVMVMTSSINGPDAKKGGIILIPNPAQGQVFLGLSEAVSREATELSIFNMMGQQVWHKTLDNSFSETGITIPIVAQPPGLYVVQIIGRQGSRWMEKLVVE